MQGWGSSTHRVCLCVCYRSSGRSGYLMSQKKVPYTWLFWRALNLANWSENVIGEYKFGEYSNIDSVHVRSACMRSSRHLKVKYLREMSCCTSVAILSSILAYLCSLLRCVGVVLQTYSAGSCGLLCKSGPHANIRWFNIFLTKERVSRDRRRHNRWLFEVLVQGIHLPSNPFLLLQIFNCILRDLESWQK